MSLDTHAPVFGRDGSPGRGNAQGNPTTGAALLGAHGHRRVQVVLIGSWRPHGFGDEYGPDVLRASCGPRRPRSNTGA